MVLGDTRVHWGVKRGTGRITAEYWGGIAEYLVVLDVLGSNRGYWGIQWSTVEYCRVLLDTTGCWGFCNG